MELAARPVRDMLFAPPVLVSAGAGDGVAAGGFAAMLASVAGAAAGHRGGASPWIGNGRNPEAADGFSMIDPASFDGEDPLDRTVAAAMALGLSQLAASPVPAAAGATEPASAGGEQPQPEFEVATAPVAAGIVTGLPIPGPGESTLTASGVAVEPGDAVGEMARESGAGRGRGPDPGPRPPGEAPALNQPGVVRFVGNATSTEVRERAASDDSTATNDPRREGPQASVQGITKAAEGSAVAALREETGPGPRPVPHASPEGIAHADEESAAGQLRADGGPAIEPTPRASAAGIAHADEKSAVGQLRADADPVPKPSPRASAAGIAHADEKSAAGQLRADAVPVLKPSPHASATGIAHAKEESVVGRLRSDGDSLPEPTSHAASNGAAHAETGAVVVPPPAAPDGAASQAAPTPSSPVRMPEVPAPVDQVASAVIEHIEQGGGEARIQLNPVELGEVTIKVKIAGDRVQLAIHAERPEAVLALRNHTVDLSALLGGRGLDLADVFVGQGDGRAQGQAEPAPWRRRRVETDGFAALLTVDDAAGIQHYNRLRAAYNPDGAHFYRV